MMSTKTIVLIGASGFIGRRILRALTLEGHQVVAVVRRKGLKLPNGAKICQCALTTKDLKLREAIIDCDAVIYAAGAVRGNCMDDFRPANVSGVEVVAEILREMEGSAPPLLLLSSLAATAPQLSNYAQSKREGENVLENFPELAATIFRPPAVYGPGDKEMMPLFDWMRRGILLQLGPANQQLSLLHVDDLARAVIAWMDCDPPVKGCFELHDGQEGGYHLKEIAEAAAPGKSMRVVAIPKNLLFKAATINSQLARLTGKLPMFSPGKARELTHSEWICNNSAITKAIGWTPEIRLGKGLQKLFSGIKE